MPMKVREGERQLRKAGFTLQPGRGKGSHRVYKHPAYRGIVTVSGNAGDDLRPYQESDIRDAIEAVR